VAEIHLREPWGAAPSARQRSFWLREALAEDLTGDDAPPLRGDRRCDVVVVGGGFTGLWTALELLDRTPGSDVCLVEADICGGGASGCNAGILMNLWPKFLNLAAMAGTDEAVWLAEQSADAVAQVRDFSVNSGADVGFRQVPWLWAAENPAQRGTWSDTLDAIASTGRSPLHEVSADQARALAGTEQMYGGVLDAGCATLDPARLARALRRAAIVRGVDIHECSPVTALRQQGGQLIASTVEGRVIADRGVLAINAWAAQLDCVGRRLVMVASDNVVTEPVPRTLAALGWDTESAVTD
jgi:glycine/D-amino acid oxidase-like deaminating enzyme